MDVKHCFKIVLPLVNASYNQDILRKLYSIIKNSTLKLFQKFE